MSEEDLSKTGILVRCLLWGLMVICTTVGCTTTTAGFISGTKVVCTAEASSSASGVSDVMSAEILDGTGAPVEVEDASLTVAQTLQEFDNGDLNYDLFSDYSYLSKLSFSYREAGETIAITLMIDPTESYSVSDPLPLVVTLNGVEQSLESEVTNSTNFIHRISVSYTTQGQDRELVITLDYNGIFVDTTYSPTVSCDLDCSAVGPAISESCKLECDYSCADGTQGNFETSGSADCDSERSEVWPGLYNEAEIQAIAANCTFAGYTAGTLPESFAVTINE